MISIVIPVYNSASFLDECLQSVYNQTYTDWECLLVDDGSTDESGAICDRWSEKDERFKVIHQENSGVSKSRNKGIENAKGEYVIFLDSDDTIGKEHVWKLVQADDADLVVSGIRQYQADGIILDSKPNEIKTFTLGKENLTDFVDLNEKFLLYGPVAKLYKVSIIRDHNIFFPEDCSYGEDLRFNLRYLNIVKTVTQVDDISYYYRRGTNTLSTKKRPDQFKQDYEQWNLLRVFYVNHDLWSEPSKELLYKRLWGIVYDGIFSTETSNKEILSIPEIKELKDYQHVFHCSKWIKWCILHRIAFVFR